MAVSGVPAPNSPSPSIDKAGKANWTGSTPKGGTPQQVLADKHTKSTVNPSSLK